MTPLIFLYLARDAGSTFADLARDIAAAARPGDHVLILDDSGTMDTAPRIGRYLAETGWPSGVSGQSIVTGARGAGDLGVAVNLGLAALAVPGEAPADARLLCLAAGSRLDPAALTAARQQADAGQHDLVLLPWAQWSLDHGRPLPAPEAADWPAQPGETMAGRSLRLAPPLQGLLADRQLWTGLRAAEGRGSHGDLALVWQILGRARQPLVTDRSMGHRPHPPDPGPDLLQAVAELAATGPVARRWCLTHLPRWMTGLTPGGRGAILTALAEKGLQAEIEPDLTVSPHIRPAPATLGRAPVRVHLAGVHAVKAAFAGPALTPLWQAHADRVADPRQADLVIWAHPRDPAGDDGRATDTAALQVLLSEQPLHDLQGPDPLARRIRVPGPQSGEIDLHQVNHHRSAIFAFDRLPYALLARPDRLQDQAARFMRNARLAPDDWAAAFAGRSAGAVFRPADPAPAADPHRPEGDLLGLQHWRDQLVGALSAGTFQGTDLSEGPDERVRILSAIEPVHQPDYMSEQLFDAFACGARPLYVASPGHRLHDLGLPAGSWVNLWGLTLDQAAAEVTALDDPARWDAGFLTAYAAAQHRLATLWTDPAVITAERARLGRALVAELQRLADFGAA